MKTFSILLGPGNGQLFGPVILGRRHVHREYNSDSFGLNGPNLEETPPFSNFSARF